MHSGLFCWCTQRQLYHRRKKTDTHLGVLLAFTSEGLHTHGHYGTLSHCLGLLFFFLAPGTAPFNVSLVSDDLKTNLYANVKAHHKLVHSFGPIWATSSAPMATATMAISESQQVRGKEWRATESNADLALSSSPLQGICEREADCRFATAGRPIVQLCMINVSFQSNWVSIGPISRPLMPSFIARLLGLSNLAFSFLH